MNCRYELVAHRFMSLSTDASEEDVDIGDCRDDTPPLLTHAPHQAASHTLHVSL